MASDIFNEADTEFHVRAWTEIRKEKGRTPTERHRVRYWYTGGELKHDIADTPEAAQAKAAAIWKAHLDGLFDKPVIIPATLGELVDLFTTRGDLSPATVQTYSKILKRFVDFTGSDRALAHVGKGAVTKWFDAMDCKPVSKAAYLRTIRALFKWAIKSRFITVDPSKDQTVERFKTVIRPWLQFPEWEAYLSGCRGPRKRLADGTVIETLSAHRIRSEFVLHTGLRAGELADAKHSWLHGTVGRPAISVPAHKSARARAIPLSARAQEVLQDAAALWPRPSDGSDSLIFGDMDEHNLRRGTVIACKRSGVTITDFHGLRRSCGARWLEVGIPLFHVSRMLGHADVSTTARHYAGLADTTLAAEIDKVDAAGRKDMIGNVIPISRAK